MANNGKVLQNIYFYFKSEVKLILLMHINPVSEHDSCSILINTIWNPAQEAGTANKTYSQTVSPPKTGNYVYTKALPTCSRFSPCGIRIAFRL